MDRQALQAVPDDDLCYAIALGRSQRRSTPDANFEMTRRNLSCSAAIMETVSDCRPLSITNPDARPQPDPDVPWGERTPDTPEVVDYVIENASARPMNFRLTWDMQVSTLQAIAANGSTELRFRVPPPAYRERLAVRTGRQVRPHLQDCKVVAGFGGVAGERVGW